MIIVSSVSCIYGLGSPEAYYGLLLYVEKDQQMSRDAVLEKLGPARELSFAGAERGSHDN